MSHQKPTYQELEARLAEADALIAALRGGQVDAVVQEQRVAVLRLKEVEDALRESEERYRTLFKKTANPILLIDTEGNYIDCNEAALQFIECTRNELLAKNIRDFIPPGKERQVLEEHERLWDSGGTAETEYYVHGGVKVLELTITPATWHGKRVVFGVGKDITERKQVEEERTRLLAELEAKNRELESFVYTVSHDLKAPLVSLGGFSAALQKEFHDRLGEEGKHYLERIQANVAHMDALIMDLLELSRIGQVVGPINEIDVVALLREIQEELAVKLEEAGAEFVVQAPLPAVRADRGRIRQVLANLIDNAVKFRSAERPLRIQVGCQEERGFYRFHVADNGIGIAPRYHEEIFTPFRQLDPVTEGVGMGLALVQKIVEHHGGRMWVESEEGKGATFYFTLPK
jgi:PAS domain S-box-containing protein